MKFFIPTHNKQLDFDGVLQRIEASNPPIETNAWKKLEEKSTSNGTFNYVSISNHCLKQIRNKGDRLFYLLGTVKINTLTENEKKKLKEITENEENKLKSEMK